MTPLKCDTLFLKVESGGMVPSGSSSNASSDRSDGGSHSHSHSRHGGGRRRSKDGGDDMRNRPLTTMHTFFNVTFEAQKMGTRVLCLDFIYGCKVFISAWVFPISAKS